MRLNIARKPRRRATRAALAAIVAILMIAVTTIALVDSTRSWTEIVLPGPSVGPESIQVAGVSQDRLCEDDGVEVNAPASTFAAQVAALPPGTCFWFNPGTYRFGNVVPKDGMTFVGTKTTEVILNGNGHENAFHGTADGVTIANMTFSGFNGDGGTKRQEQAPIRGTRAIWASTRGTMATNWTIDSIVSRDNFASGLFLGDNFHVLNSEFYGNGTTGIAGNEIVGGIIENNLIYGNGVYAATGALENGGGLKVTQAGTLARPMIVRNNEVFDNRDIGIWCDIACRGFQVINNHIHDHRSAGVSIELSSGALIEGNRIERSSTWTDFSIDWNAGAVTIAESADTIVRNNYVADSKGGIIVRQTLRPARPIENFLDSYEFVTFVVDDVTVENNTIVDVDLMGYTTGRTGHGLAPNPQSIRFVNNRFDDPQQVSFAHGEDRFNYDGWAAAGRDTEQGGVLPPASSFGINAGTTTTPDSSPPPTDSEDPGTSPGSDVTLPLRINAGGPAVTAGGVNWSSDQFFEGGNVAVRDGVPVASTALDTIYQSERWGVDDYAIPLADGTYQVVLHHSEMYEGCQQSSCRVFDVAVEGQPAATDLDIYATVGGHTAFTTTLTVQVDDGVLDISFGQVVQEPQISGIEILPAFAESSESDDRSSESITPPAQPPTPTSNGSTAEEPATDTAQPGSTPTGGGSAATPTTSSGDATDELAIDELAVAEGESGESIASEELQESAEVDVTAKDQTQQQAEFGIGGNSTTDLTLDELSLKESNPAGLQKFSAGDAIRVALLVSVALAAVVGMGMALSHRRESKTG